MSLSENLFNFFRFSLALLLSASLDSFSIVYTSSTRDLSAIVKVKNCTRQGSKDLTWVKCITMRRGPSRNFPSASQTQAKKLDFMKLSQKRKYSSHNLNVYVVDISLSFNKNEVSNNFNLSFQLDFRELVQIPQTSYLPIFVCG